MIRFACPGCASTFSVDDAKAGKSGKCPKCQAQFIIPQLEAAPAPVPVPVPLPPTAADPNAPVEIDPCPKCQTKLSVTAADLGNDVECPYCKTVFAAARLGSRPPAPPPAPGKKSSFETDFSSRPKAKRRDDDEDDDRPSRRRRDDDDEDDRPAKRRRDDDDDRPSRRRAASRRDDDDDDRPSRRRSSRRYDEEDDDRPSRRRRRPSRRRGGSGTRSGAVTAVGILTLIIGGLNLLAAGFIFFAFAWFTSFIGQAPRAQVDPQARNAAEAGILGAALCCGTPFLLLALLHILGGSFTLQRKQAGRVLVIICAVLSLIGGLIGLYGLLQVISSQFATTQAVLINLLSTGLSLGYGIFALVVMFKADYADEFD